MLCPTVRRFVLRNYSRRSAAKNGGSEGSARESAIHYQLDRVDVRRIVRGKKKHSLGQIFRLAPTGKWNRGREEVGDFLRIPLPWHWRAPRASRWELSSLPGPPRSRESSRCKVCGDGSRHRDESAFRSSVGGHAWLTEIIVHRSVEDDAAVVVNERSG